MGRSGSGFVRCADGVVRWGHFGAAGVLFRTPDDDAGWRFLVQLRSPHSHEGGTWAVPGGALDEHESALEGAMREAAEELGPLPDWEPAATLVDHVADDWSYTTIVATVSEPFAARLNWETTDVRWVTTDELESLPLHNGFRDALERLLPLATEPVGDPESE